MVQKELLNCCTRRKTELFFSSSPSVNNLQQFFFVPSRVASDYLIIKHLQFTMYKSVFLFFHMSFDTIQLYLLKTISYIYLLSICFISRINNISVLSFYQHQFLVLIFASIEYGSICDTLSSISNHALAQAKSNPSSISILVLLSNIYLYGLDP